MSKYEGHYLTLEQAALLYPLYREMQWLSEQEVDCGAVAYFLDNEQYDDESINLCLRYLKEEKYYPHPDGKIPDEVIKRETDIAEALTRINEQHREMVCNGTTHTEGVFALINMDEKNEPSRIIIPGMQ